MAVTRKALREKFGDEFSDANITEMLNIIHAEVDSVRDERDALQKQLEGITKERDEATAAKAKAEEDLESFKNETANKETRSAKEAAVRSILSSLGMSEKRVSTVLKTTDFDSVELSEDGKIKGEKAFTEALKSEWSEFIPQTETKSAEVATPPASTANTVTKEQFNRMGYNARVELYNTNPELYQELCKEN